MWCFSFYNGVLRPDPCHRIDTGTDVFWLQCSKENELDQLRGLSSSRCKIIGVVFWAMFCMKCVLNVITEGADIPDVPGCDFLWHMNSQGEP